MDLKYSTAVYYLCLSVASDNSQMRNHGQPHGD
jgi:hypothetical protein